MKLKTLVLALSVVGLTACSATPETTLNTEKVVVSQAGDSKLTCEQIEPKLEAMETEVKTMLVEKHQRANKTFAATAVVDLTLALLAGSANANNRIDRSTLDDFTQPEMARIQSLADRHNHLMVIAKDKQCEFVPKVEARIAKYKQTQTSITPALDDQAYRKRVSPN